MERCTYELNWKGNSIEFGNSAELDYYIYNNLEEFKWDRVNKKRAKFSAKTTLDKIDEIKRNISNNSKVVKQYDPLFGGVEEYYIIDGSIGANRFIDVATINGKGIVTKFDQESYFKEEGLYGDQKDTVLNGWKIEADASSLVHKIGEQMMANDKVENIGDMIPFGENESKRKEMLNAFKSSFKLLKSTLKERHGDDCTILTEVPIISKELLDPYSNEYKSINGKIDLLVIDRFGRAHIYDYKMSKKNVGKWDLEKREGEWDGGKKLKIEYQLEIYRTILEQHGINVASVGIIPIKVEYNTENKNGIETPTTINNFSFKEIITDSNGLKRRSENISKILPIKYLTDNIDGVKSIEEPMDAMFPGHSLNVKGERSRATFDSIKKTVHELSDSDPDRSKGKYWFYNKFHNKNNGKIYCNSIEEIDEEIKKYVEKIYEEASNEWFYISKQLSAIYDGSQEYESLSLKTASRNENEYIRRIFKKYLNNPNGYKWKYHKNDSLSAAGIFIFTNDNNIAEIVMLSEQELDQVVNLGKGTSLLGADKYDFEVDEHKVFKATNGNLKIMETICLLNYAHNNFKGYKINSIKIHNTRSQKSWEQAPDVMFGIFKDSANLHKDKVQINLTDSNFTSTLEHVEHAVEYLCGESIMNLTGTQFAYSADDIYINLEVLNRLRDSLETRDDVYREIRSESPNFENPAVLAWLIVQKAISKLKGYNVYVELNPAVNLGFKGGLHVGLNWSSSENSPSLNVQTVGNIVAKASVKINQETTKLSSEIRRELDNLYKSKNRSSLIGGEVKFFDNLFRVDANGNKDPRFLLKKENDSSLSREERDFIVKFLQIVNELKYDGNEARIAEIRNTDHYYEVPLAMSRGYSTFYNSSMKELVKREYNEALNFLNIFDEQQSDLSNSKKQWVAYNKYKLGDDARNKILSDNNINMFETHLGVVIIDLINTYCKEKVWNSVLPDILGIQLFMKYQQIVEGNVSQNTIDYIDKYVDVNIFSKPIMDLQPVYKVLSSIRSVTGATVLGFNLRSGIRELMQGMWNHLSRSMVQMYGKDMFKSSDILKAWTIVFKLSIKNPNLISLLDAVNAEYGMANADIDSIKELLSQSKAGVLNWGSDSLFIFNRIPDAYHRMGILIAQMLHDGCWEAHFQDENGNLIYDFKKDERFNLLTNPNANKNGDEYKKQLDLYLSMCDQFRMEGYEIPKYDGKITPLPRAYTIQEGLSIKSFADLCFGHYDKRTQMLAKHMFLGSFFLQFRTFLSAKLEQWILKPGTYNIGAYKELYDVDGIRIMRVIKFDDNGMPTSVLKREDELEKGELATPHKEWQGRFMEGIAYSMWDFGNALAKMNTEKLKDLWKNDTKRANFWLFINDMLLMSIMMAVIQALLLDNDEIEWNPGTHMMAMALYTSFSDGPITQLLASMGGDLNPPMYSTIKNMYNNTVNVVTGDMKISEYFTGTFGALRDLEYLVK